MEQWVDRFLAAFAAAAGIAATTTIDAPAGGPRLS